MIHLTLRRDLIQRWLWSITALLLVLSLAVNALRVFAGHDTLFGLARLLDVDLEQSLPTFFSECLLLGSAGMLALISRVAKRQGDPLAVYWAWLGLGFFWLALDEVAGIHEALSRPAQLLVNFLPLPSRSWVLVGALGAIGVLVLFIPFLRGLPAKTRRIFLLAGAIYVVGAVGVEIPEGIHGKLYGKDLGYALYAALEEGMEMSGVVLFLGELLAHYAARNETVGLVVQVGPKP